MQRPELHKVRSRTRWLEGRLEDNGGDGGVAILKSFLCM